MALSKRLRYEILRRDNHACRYCGATAPDVKLTVDHVLPTVLGGSDDPTNLATACASCNSGKSSASPDAPLVADVSQDAIRWARARDVAAQRVGSVEQELHTCAVRSYQYWADSWEGAFGWIPDVPPDALYAMVAWLRYGLCPRDLMYFTDRTVTKYETDRSLSQHKVWNYFAGCCWTRLREIEATAHELINAGEV